MSAGKPNRRAYGSGQIVVGADAKGGETFYGVWYADGRRVKRRLGAKRPRGGRTGLTTAQAERELRRLDGQRDTDSGRGRPSDALGGGEQYRAHLTMQGRKRATVAAVESAFRVRLDSKLGDRTLDAITDKDVEDLMRSMAGAGVGAKSIRNYVGTLSAL